MIGGVQGGFANGRHRIDAEVTNPHIEPVSTLTRAD
jgi:hypothetical protein